VQRPSSALPAWGETTAGRQVAGEGGEHWADLAAAPLVTTDDRTVGHAHHSCHVLLSEAELEPNTLQLLRSTRRDYRADGYTVNRDTAAAASGPKGPRNEERRMIHPRAA
jgi:hypothetical protein